MCGCQWNGQGAGSGIGGGGVLVPLYITAWKFQTERSVALSNFTIAGGALANFVCNVKRCAIVMWVCQGENR
jgi:uncharacterized membrane protein YfcA